MPTLLRLRLGASLFAIPLASWRSSPLLERPMDAPPARRQPSTHVAAAHAMGVSAGSSGRMSKDVKVKAHVWIPGAAHPRSVFLTNLLPSPFPQPTRPTTTPRRRVVPARGTGVLRGRKTSPSPSTKRQATPSASYCSWPLRRGVVGADPSSSPASRTQTTTAPTRSRLLRRKGFSAQDKARRPRPEQDLFEANGEMIF